MPCSVRGLGHWVPHKFCSTCLPNCSPHLFANSIEFGWFAQVLEEQNGKEEKLSIISGPHLKKWQHTKNYPLFSIVLKAMHHGLMVSHFRGLTPPLPHTLFFQAGSQIGDFCLGAPGRALRPVVHVTILWAGGLQFGHCWAGSQMGDSCPRGFDSPTVKPQTPTSLMNGNAAGPHATEGLFVST